MLCNFIYSFDLIVIIHNFISMICFYFTFQWQCQIYSLETWLNFSMVGSLENLFGYVLESECYHKRSSSRMFFWEEQATALAIRSWANFFACRCEVRFILRVAVEDSWNLGFRWVQVLCSLLPALRASHAINTSGLRTPSN